MSPTVTSSTSTSTNGYAALVPPAPSTDVTKNMFMQLLVAQLKNQDPLNPSDGTQFITQLAQFQQLEQSVNTGQDITTMRQDLDQLVGKTATTTGSSNSTSGTQH